MKLLRYGPSGEERPGLLDATGTIRDLSGVVDDISAHVLSDESLGRLRALDANTLPIVDAGTRLGPCVSGVGKFVCIGLNYSDHAKESNMPIPQEPILFMKATSSISGCNDPIMIPDGSEKTDWEIELGVVIGQSGSRIEVSDATDHVAGFCIVNDLSERCYQLEHGGQWVKGKSCDTFGPIGPWLVTRDDVPDPQNLRMWLEVDGYRYQDGSTKTMIFGVAELIAYCSRFMSLHPGDIISTGTPPGVGMGQKPSPIYLRAGQVVQLSIEGLGVQEQTAVGVS